MALDLEGTPHIIEHIIETYNKIQYYWMDHKRQYYTYDAKENLIKYICKYWNGVKWSQNMQLRLFDSNNNIIELLCQKWKDNVWINYLKF